MARIRTIKPEFFLHEELFDLESTTGLPIRIAYVGLWCEADREGRFRWSPRRLKACILPYDDVDFSRVLDALATRGFVVKYACPTREPRVDEDCADECFGVIPAFLKHQIVNNRERESDIPAPDASILQRNNLTRAPRVPHACPTRAPRVPIGKGREGNKSNKGTHAFKAPTVDDVVAYCKARNNAVDAQHFVDYYTARGWRLARSPMKDWQAAVRTWEKNDRNNELASRVATAEDARNWVP